MHKYFDRLRAAVHRWDGENVGELADLLGRLEDASQGRGRWRPVDELGIDVAALPSPAGILPVVLNRTVAGIWAWDCWGGVLMHDGGVWTARGRAHVLRLLAPQAARAGHSQVHGYLERTARRFRANGDEAKAMSCEAWLEDAADYDALRFRGAEHQTSSRAPVWKVRLAA